MEYVPQVAREGLWLALLLALPFVAAVALAGLLSASLQAATRLQEPTLSALSRLLAVALVLALAGPWMASQAARFAQQLWASLPWLAR